MTLMVLHVLPKQKTSLTLVTLRLQMMFMHGLAGCMTDERAARLFAALSESKFILKIKFLHEQNEGDWVVEDKFDLIRTERKKGQGIIVITQDTKSCVLN